MHTPHNLSAKLGKFLIKVILLLIIQIQMFPDNIQVGVEVSPLGNLKYSKWRSKWPPLPLILLQFIYYTQQDNDCGVYIYVFGVKECKSNIKYSFELKSNNLKYSRWPSKCLPLSLIPCSSFTIHCRIMILVFIYIYVLGVEELKYNMQHYTVCNRPTSQY